MQATITNTEQAIDVYPAAQPDISLSGQFPFDDAHGTLYTSLDSRPDPPLLFDPPAVPLDRVFYNERR